MDLKGFDGGGSEPERYPCGTCGRKFFPESLERHEVICRKHELKSRKRKVFSSGKQRAEGTGIPLSKTVKPIENKTDGVKITNWRQNHLDFVNAIRSARSAQKAIKTGAPLPPPPPPSINPDYVPCPYCNRRFNAKAGARHIPFCQQRTRTYGEPIKALTQRAAADVGGSKTGRRKAYYQKVVRKKEINQRSSYGQPPSFGNVPVYSSAFGGGGVYSFHDDRSNDWRSQSRTTLKQFQPTTSPRRRIVSASVSSPSNFSATPPYASSTPVSNPPNPKRPVTGNLKKSKKCSTPKGNVRFSEQVETFHMPPSPDGTLNSIENVAVVSPYLANQVNSSVGQGGDFLNHYSNQEHLRSVSPKSLVQDRMSPGGITRNQMEREQINGRMQSNPTQYETTTSLSFGNTSVHSSGYNSDLSPCGSPMSPKGDSTSPRVQGMANKGSSHTSVSTPSFPKGQLGTRYKGSYQNGGVNTPPTVREASLLKRENSILASFCHDCGTQFPTPSSKFCCSCGIQRAFISPR